MNPVACSVYPVLAFSAPVGVWLLSQLLIPDGDTQTYTVSATVATQNLLLLQFIFLVLYLPRLWLSLHWKKVFQSMAIFICVSLPIFFMAWLMGASTLMAIIYGQASLFCTGVLLLLLTNGLASVVKPEKYLNLSLSSIQVLLVITLWANREFIY